MAGYSSGYRVSPIHPRTYADLAGKLQAAEDNFFLYGSNPSDVRSGLVDVGPDTRVSDYSYQFDSVAYDIRASFAITDPRALAFAGRYAYASPPPRPARWGKITCNDRVNVLEFVVL